MARMKDYEELTFGDDYMFNIVMKNVDITKYFLEELLEREISEITYCGTQVDEKMDLRSRMVRFDVKFVGDDVIYDVEMQQQGSATLDGQLELFKRVRYHQSVLDNSSMPEGGDIKDLPQTYIIFICRFDLFKQGLAKYTQVPYIEELDEVINNHTKVIYLNSKYKSCNVSTDIQELLKYIESPKSYDESGDFIHRVNHAVQYAYKDAEQRKEYLAMCSFYDKAAEEGRIAGREEGRAEGREEGRIEGREEGRAEGRSEGRAEGHGEICLALIPGIMHKYCCSKKEAVQMLKGLLEASENAPSDIINLEVFRE